MSMEPITLFARIADAALVARLLRKMAPRVEIDGPDDNWQNAVAVFGDGTQRRILTLTHDREYYSEPNWSTQMAGMRGYFSGFPDTERKEMVMMLTTSFCFSLGTLFEPDFDPEGDPRLDALFAVTEALDGVLFTPSSLRDAHGRILFSAEGEDEEDPHAVWPRVLGEVSTSEPLGAAMHEASRPRSPDDEPADADPPTATRVARRALALTAVTARAILEQDAAKTDSNAIATYEDLLDWVEKIGIDDELEPEEWEVLQRPLGRLDLEQQIDATWRLEGLVVLAWGLGRFDIPPHDQLVNVNALWETLGLLDVDGAQALLADPPLRPRQEIGNLRNRLFALHWRLRNYHLHGEVLDFAEFGRTCWFGPLDLSDLSLIDGDLAIGGERIDRAAPDQLGNAQSAAQERHQAANWLWEGPERYSDASVAT